MLKMKDPLAEAYRDTPADALARLSAGAFARCDAPELHRITGSFMDKGRSRTSRTEFILQRHALTEAALLWALDCWQTYASICETTAIIASPIADAKPPTGAIFLQGAMNAKLASLIEAQREICRRKGMDFVDIAGLASLSAMRLRDEDAKPIPKLVDELIEQYGV